MICDNGKFPADPVLQSFGQYSRPTRVFGHFVSFSSKEGKCWKKCPNYIHYIKPIYTQNLSKKKTTCLYWLPAAHEIRRIRCFIRYRNLRFKNRTITYPLNLFSFQDRFVNGTWTLNALWTVNASKRRTQNAKLWTMIARRSHAERTVNGR